MINDESLELIQQFDTPSMALDPESQMTTPTLLDDLKNPWAAKDAARSVLKQ